MGGECGMQRRERRDVERVVEGKSQGKRPLRTPRYRWEINKNRFFSRTEGRGLD
jgi:hypothetical protein